MRLIVRLLLFLTLPVTLAWTDSFSGEFLAGQEIAGEALVSWTAVVEKITVRQNQLPRVKAKVSFTGQTMQGNRIRGSGKMRFVGSREFNLSAGSSLQSEGLLDYWVTVSGLFGDDLVMTKGVGYFENTTNKYAPFSRAILELKAGIDIVKND